MDFSLSESRGLKRVQANGGAKAYIGNVDFNVGWQSARAARDAKPLNLWAVAHLSDTRKCDWAIAQNGFHNRV